MGMREVVLAALIGALIVIAAVAVPALALESPGFHAVVYPVALALFVPYAWLTLPAVLKEGHEMTALYALFVSMAIATVWAIGELSGRSIGRMRLIVLEGALVSVMALSFASVLISLGVTNTLILSSPLAVAAMIYIVAALVGIVPPEGVEAGISDNAATASIPSNIEVETIISRDEEKDQTQTPPSVEIHENLPTICIENAEEETPSIPAIVVPEEAGEEPVPAINCEAEAPATAEEAAIMEEPLIIAEEEAPAPVVIEEEPIPAEPAIIAEEEAIPAEAVAIIEEETIPAETAPAEEIAIEEPVEEVLIEEESAIIEPEVIAEAVIEEPSPAEEIAEPVIVEEEGIIPVENESVLVEDAKPAIIEEEPAPIAAIEEDVIQIPRPPAITVSSRLSVPTAPTLTNTAKLEEPRVPSAPSLSNTAELVEETAVYEAPRWEDDDFWSTFYIAGQDDLELEDGVYYFDLYVNDEYTSEIEILMQNDEPSLLVSGLKDAVAAELTDDAFNRIFIDGGKYVSVSRLNELDVNATYNTADYTVDIYFSAEDMPIRTISLSSGIRRIARRPLAGGLSLAPAVFTLASRYTLYTRFNFGEWDYFVNSLRFRFDSYNEARLYDVYLDFDYSFDFTTKAFDFDFGSYEFYTDFPDSSIRLSWGNISTDLLSSNGTPVGIKFEKSPTYSGSTERRTNRIEEVLVIDKRSEVQVFNEGREIYNDTLNPGIYRLEDFTLYSGINHITVRVTPLDGSPSYEKEIDIVYSYSLLARGDVDYGAAIAVGRSDRDKDFSTAAGQVKLPLLTKSLVYDFRNVTMSGFVNAGLTDSLTLDTTIALQNNPTEEASFRPVMRLATELTHANILGTTRYNFNVSERSNEFGEWRFPGFYARIGHQVSTGWTPINSFNIALAYSSPNEVNVENRHRFSLSTGISGRLGIMGYSLNYGGIINTDRMDRYDWNLGATASFSFSRNIYLSATLNINTENLTMDMSDVSGRVSMTFYFNGGNVNMQTTGQDLAINATAKAGRHSFAANADLNRIVNPDSYGFGFGYDYSGRYINAGVDLDAYDMFRRGSGSVTLSTSTLFADGLFAVNSYIPSNYMLIHQGGALKGNDLSVGYANNASTDTIKTLFNTALYTGVSSTNNSSFAVYSIDNDSFSGGNSFEFNIPYSRRRGYAVRLTAEDKLAASGIVEFFDGSVLANGASPLYSVTIEDGAISLSQTEKYIFTDNDGRFIITDLSVGTYAFDVPIGNNWQLYIFEVSEIQGDGDIEVYADIAEVSDFMLPTPYRSAFMFTDGTQLTSNEFWEMLYPAIEEVV